MDRVEGVLAEWFGAPASLTFGRGTTGLYAVFEALAEGQPGGEVLIPEICCESVALAVLYAGLEPVFVDVERETLGMSVEDAARKMGPATLAVVVVHVFGIPARITSILDLARRHGAVVVEDIAQAVGGKVEGATLGTTGDLALLSFDEAKIIGGSGGAVVFNRATDEFVARVAKIRDRLDHRVLPQQVDRLALSLRNLTHAMADLWRTRAAGPQHMYRSLVGVYEPALVIPRCTIDADELERRLAGLAQQQARRYARYDQYRTGLRRSRWEVVDLPEGAMCWRVALLGADMGAALAAASDLQAREMPASNHYFPLGLLFDGLTAPVAGDLGLRLVNVWVDTAVSDAEVRAAVARLAS